MSVEAVVRDVGAQAAAEAGTLYNTSESATVDNEFLRNVGKHLPAFSSYIRGRADCPTSRVSSSSSSDKVVLPTIPDHSQVETQSNVRSGQSLHALLDKEDERFSDAEQNESQTRVRKRRAEHSRKHALDRLKQKRRAESRGKNSSRYFGSDVDDDDDGDLGERLREFEEEDIAELAEGEEEEYENDGFVVGDDEIEMEDADDSFLDDEDDSDESQEEDGTALTASAKNKHLRSKATVVARWTPDVLGAFCNILLFNLMGVTVTPTEENDILPYIQQTQSMARSSVYAHKLRFLHGASAWHIDSVERCVRVMGIDGATQTVSCVVPPKVVHAYAVSVNVRQWLSLKMFERVKKAHKRIAVKYLMYEGSELTQWAAEGHVHAERAGDKARRAQRPKCALDPKFTMRILGELIDAEETLSSSL